jgi:hypothetical protein
MEETRTIELSAELVSDIERRLPHTEWETSSEYVSFVMNEVLYQVQESTDESPYDDVDETEVENRLEALGYLNE